MVSWKAPWFIRLDVDEAFPHPQKTREPFGRPGAALGPLATARDAERLIEQVQDAFDLCRSLACLRQSPNGPRCAYAEMGRCVSVADGSISMDDYRVLASPGMVVRRRRP